MYSRLLFRFLRFLFVFFLAMFLGPVKDPSRFVRRGIPFRFRSNGLLANRGRIKVHYSWGRSRERVPVEKGEKKEKLC